MRFLIASFTQHLNETQINHIPAAHSFCTPTRPSRTRVPHLPLPHQPTNMKCVVKKPVVWVWVKNLTTRGPQVLVCGSIYQGSILGTHF